MSEAELNKQRLRRERLAKLAQIQDIQSEQSRSRSRSRDKKKHDTLQKNQKEENGQREQTEQRENKDQNDKNEQKKKEAKKLDLNGGISSNKEAPAEPSENLQEEENAQSYPEQDEMQKMLGFSSFNTSKNKDHSQNSCQAVFKNSKARRQYRQYMNRRGGFDRNLDKI